MSNFYVGVSLRSNRYSRMESRFNEMLDVIRHVHDELDGNAVQIYLGDATNTQRKIIDSSLLTPIRDLIVKLDMKIFVHASMALDFCKPPKMNRGSINSYVNELKNCDVIGAPGAVLHMGIYYSKRIQQSNMKISYSNSFNNFIASMKEIIKEKRRRKIDAKIILETPAQFSKICTSFEHMALLFNSLSNDEQRDVSFCIDTAHLHSSGYDIRESEMAKDVFLHWDSIIGLDRVTLIHYNDSVYEIGTGVDQHAVPGYGYIGDKEKGGGDGLISIAKIAKKYDIPLIQETKDDDFKTRIADIKKWSEN